MTKEETIKFWLSSDNERGRSLLHDYFCGLAEVEKPPEYVLVAGLLLKGKDDDTPLHYAAQYRCLDEIPTSLLSEEALTRKNSYGYTPLHDAAASGSLNQIPTELLTEKALTIKDTDGSTPLDLARLRDKLWQLKGLEFSPAVIPQVGQGWFDTNVATINARKQLSQQEQEQPEIDIF